MYSRAEASRMREEFWIAFGKYMAPHPSAFGHKVNWVNYKSGIKGIFFRMDADTRNASIAIEISVKDQVLQDSFYQKFLEVKTLLFSSAGNEWEFQPQYHDTHGKIISRISKTIDNVNIMDKSSWAELITFFKKNIIGIDEFWSSVKDLFEDVS